MADFYELQRAMRAMRQAALQRGALAILDPVSYTHLRAHET